MAMARANPRIRKNRLFEEFMPYISANPDSWFSQYLVLRYINNNQNKTGRYSVAQVDLDVVKGIRPVGSLSFKDYWLSVRRANPWAKLLHKHLKLKVDSVQLRLTSQENEPLNYSLSPQKE